LIKYSLNQKHFNSSNFLWYCIIWGCFFAFISCHYQPTSEAQNNSIQKSGIIRSVAKYTVAVPKITPLTTRNHPRVVRAKNPVVKADLSGIGIPFFTNYNTEQGLPVNNIICSITDKAGNLWFGTGGGGVSKYDGKNFTNYTMAQGLAGVVVFCILEDKEGNLWIGTTSGISKYDGRKFTNFTTSDGLANDFVTCALQDAKGNLWFGTHDGLSEYDGKNFRTYTTANGLANNYVRCIMQDSDGSIWLGADAGGVVKYDGSKFTNYTLVTKHNSVNSIAQDNKSNLWFGTNAGVSKYDGAGFENFTTSQGLADNNVSCVLQDASGDIWFGTHTKGVSRYDGKKFTNYSKHDGLADNKINSIMKDKSGNLWITSQGGGVSKYEGNSVTSYTTEQGLANNLVFSIIQDQSGNMWFGTYEGGVCKYDGKSFETYTKTEGFPDISIWSMLADKAGNIWFGTDREGATKFDGKNFTNYTTEQGLAGNAVISMIQDKAGNIWFGTRGNGVSKFDGNTFTNYSPAGLTGGNIWSINEDTEGNVRFGTFGDGAIKFDGKGFTKYTSAQGLAGDAVTAIIQDAKGILWFGTAGNGISKYDGKRFINYSSEEGLPDNDVSNITQDTSRSIIWFGTNKGLARLNVKSSNNSDGHDIEFENLNKNTGYPIKDLSTGGQFTDNKGIVWVGSGAGRLIRFDYVAVNKVKKLPMTLEIQNVKVNNENICWNNLLRMRQGINAADSLTMLNEMFTSFGKELTPQALERMREKYRNIKLDGVTKFYPIPINLVLPYEDNNITIDFVAIEPALPKQVKYQYKLEGYSNEWSPENNNSSAVFGNISAGDYTFKLKALSPLGVWSEKEYSFKVLPPWWLTWWAYTLYGLLAGGVLYAFYRSRIRNMEHRQAAEMNIMVATQEAERKRISQDLHDDIGARLTNINMLSALGQQKINKPQDMLEHLKRISSEIQTSGEALDDIVWSIDTKNDSIEEVTARMRRYAADVFDGTSILYTITINEKSLPAKLSSGKRRDLFLVFKETINNIRKHAMATIVEINIGSEEINLLMEISDNGKGFDTSQPTYRNGLKNMEQRIRKWEGTFSLQSSPGIGTILKITLPV
jgi:ligand-binding sensor domain-containing protein/signal transduction histidine kinase